MFGSRFIPLCWALVTLIVSVPLAHAERETISVGNISELIQAIGSHRLIKLKAGTYKVDRGVSSSNPHVEINESDYYGPNELIIKNVEDMSLEGDASGSTILETKRLAKDITFQKSKQISLKHLTLSYTVEEKETRGDLVWLEDVEDASFSDLHLVCNGANGFRASNSKKLSFERTTVEKCSTIMSISGTSTVHIADSVFRENTGGFYLWDSKNVTLDRVTIEKNQGISVFEQDEAGGDITINNSKLAHNQFSSLHIGNGALTINKSKVIDSGAIGASLKNSIAPELLVTGSFAPEGVTLKTGDEWLGLFEAPEKDKPERYELRKVKIIVEPADLTVVQGVSVTTSEKVQPIFMVRGLPSFSEGEIKTVQWTPPSALMPLPLGHEEFLNFGDHYLLASEGVAEQKPSSDKDATNSYLTISNYRLSLKRKSTDGFKSVYKPLLTFDSLGEDTNLPGLVWAGDLDRDNVLDLLVRVGGEGSYLVLFLSSISEEKDGLPVRACKFDDTVGC